MRPPICFRAGMAWRVAAWAAGAKKNPDPYFTNGLAAALQRNIDAHAQRLQNIRRTATRTRGAIAVLGHARTGRRRNNRSRSGNIKRFAAVATRSASVDQMRGPQSLVGKNGSRVTPHHTCKSRQVLAAESGAHSWRASKPTISGVSMRPDRISSMASWLPRGTKSFRLRRVATSKAPWSSLLRLEPSS